MLISVYQQYKNIFVNCALRYMLIVSSNEDTINMYPYF